MIEQNKLGNRIKELINSKNLSMAKFEQIAGLKPGAARDIIIGNSRNPTINTLNKICKALACSLNDLVENEWTVQEVPLLNRYGNTEWDVALFTKCAEIIEKYLQTYQLKFSLYKTLNLITELYLHSLLKNNRQIDKKSAEWSVEKLQGGKQ